MKKTSSKQSFLQFRNDYELLLNNCNIIKSLCLRVSVVHELFKLIKLRGNKKPAKVSLPASNLSKSNDTTHAAERQPDY